MLVVGSIPDRDVSINVIESEHVALERKEFDFISMWDSVYGDYTVAKIIMCLSTEQDWCVTKLGFDRYFSMSDWNARLMYTSKIVCMTGRCVHSEWQY